MNVKRQYLYNASKVAIYSENFSMTLMIINSSAVKYPRNKRINKYSSVEMFLCVGKIYSCRK